MPDPSKPAVSPEGNGAAGPVYTEGPAAQASRVASLALLWVSGSSLVLITLIILWQVFARYILNASPSWSEQLALYVLVWMVFLAAAAGVRERFHIRITAVQDAAPGGLRLTSIILAHLVTLMIGGFLAAYGLRLVTALWAYQIPTLGLPRGSSFLALPIAGLLMALFSIEHIAALIRGREVRPVWR